jgi:hypothetical protein
MPSLAGLICFYCGKTFSTTALNRADGGDPCPVCAERLLHALPPLIPGPGSPEHVQAGETGDSADPSQTGGGPPDLPRPA